MIPLLLLVGCFAGVLSIHAPNAGMSKQPFKSTDQITVDEVLRRYTYLRHNLHPDVMRDKINQMPQGLRSKLMMVTISMNGGRGALHCYNQCLQSDTLNLFLENRYQSHSIGDFFFVMYVRDELHDRIVKQYIESAGYPDGVEHDRLLAKYKQLIIQLPAGLFSVDLDQPTERNKFVVPDRFMTLSEKWNPFRMWQEHRDKARSGSARFPWDQKLPKVFWRGVDSGHSYDYVDVFSNMSKYFPRMELLWQSHLHPEVVDARLSGIYLPYTRAALTRVGMPEMQEISFVDVVDHMRYKYLISVDGWTAAWMRPNWIMASNSVLIKQESNKVEWFTHAMKPYKHYYPVGNGLEGLVEAVKYLEQHQDEANAIVKEANAFTEKHFIPEVMTDAICKLFRDYSSAQKREIERVNELRQKEEAAEKARKQEQQRKKSEAASKQPSIIDENMGPTSQP